MFSFVSGKPLSMRDIFEMVSPRSLGMGSLHGSMCIQTYSMGIMLENLSGFAAFMSEKQNTSFFPVSHYLFETNQSSQNSLREN